MSRLPDLACGLAGLLLGTVAAVALSNRPVPGMHLALYSPLWSADRVLSAITASGALPVSPTKLPGAWVVHLPLGGSLPGALTTNAEAVLALTGACALSPSPAPREREGPAP